MSPSGSAPATPPLPKALRRDRIPTDSLRVHAPPRPDARRSEAFRNPSRQGLTHPATRSQYPLRAPGHFRAVMTDLEDRTEASAAVFVGRHQRAVWRWLRALGCEPHRADEHCQDALLAALHGGVDRLPADEAAAWLRTTSRNLFLMALRQEQRRPPVVAFEELERQWLRLRADADGGDAALAALADCVQHLPERERALVDQRYVQRCSRAAMAQQQGIGEAGIKMALRRARTRLRACIEGKLEREDRR